MAVLIARQRINLTQKDVQELERIVNAASRARDTLIICRQAYVETGL